MPEGPETKRNTDYVRRYLGLRHISDDSNGCIDPFPGMTSLMFYSSQCNDNSNSITDYMIKLTDHYHLNSTNPLLINVYKIFHDGLTRYNKSNADIRLLQHALNKPIIDFRCKGKSYFIFLSGGVGIYAHHMMGGRWTFEPETTKNVHFILQFKHNNDNESGFINLCFENEQFGQFKILNTLELLEKWYELAPSILSITKEQWKMNIIKAINNAKSKKTSNLLGCLLDQNIICSGAGNYLVAEIFYHAKLHPEITLRRIYELNIIDSLYTVVVGVANGFYNKTLAYNVYGKKITQFGNEVVATKYERKHYWCPIEQTII